MNKGAGLQGIDRNEQLCIIITGQLMAYRTETDYLNKPLVE